MDLNVNELGIKDIADEVNRHSRILSRQAELSGN